MVSVFLVGMRLAIDDLPRSESVSRLRARGEITPYTTVTTVSFPDAGVSLNIGVTHRRFPNGGSWSFFVCPCGRRCRFLRLYNDALACRGCLKARGFRHRVGLFSYASKRAAYTAPRRIERLNSAVPARLHPRNGQTLDRRVRFEASLRRSLIVARQHAIDEHDKMLEDT
jgi:hypothetical protein